MVFCPRLPLILSLCLAVAGEILTPSSSVQSSTVISSTRAALVSGKNSLENSTQPFCFNGHSGSKTSFAKGQWKSYFSPNFALVYPFCLTTTELGNRLGNYFNELSCAEVVGVHFVTVHQQWDLTGSLHGNKSVLDLNSRLAFLNALPQVAVHANPLTDMDVAVKRINQECACTRYCWQDKAAPWVKNIPSLRKVLRKAIRAYLSANHGHTSTTVSPDTDFISAFAVNAKLPLVPDVALQYRCGDNLGFSYMYGILPFFAFLSRIPPESKFIYVLSDHPSRAPHSPYSSRCQTILQKLFTYLQDHFPKATIVVKRGGDLFLDYARLAFANTTICSASSYCLWPALANTGTAYFPLSSVVAGADSIELAPALAPNFHWIEDPKIISDFRKFRPWDAVLKVLTGEEPLPA